MEQSLRCRVNNGSVCVGGGSGTCEGSTRPFGSPPTLLILGPSGAARGRPAGFMRPRVATSFRMKQSARTPAWLLGDHTVLRFPIARRYLPHIRCSPKHLRAEPRRRRQSPIGCTPGAGLPTLPPQAGGPQRLNLYNHIWIPAGRIYDLL